MKRFVSMLLVLILLSAMAVPASAAGAKVHLTADSGFTVGSTATVDILATKQSVMSDGSVTSDMYNAALDGGMTYLWRCSNGPDKQGQSVTWISDDIGREYFCRVGFYADKECTQFVDYIDGDVFVVTASNVPAPTITTTWLPDAAVGEDYYTKIDCTDADAVFTEFMGSQLSEFGLYVTQHGEIEGKPTKTGRCQVNLLATGEGGEDSCALEIMVREGFEPGIEIINEPKKMTYQVGEKVDLTGLKVKITTHDGSTLTTENGQYLVYYQEPLQNVGDTIKIKLSHGDIFTFLYITVGPAASVEPEITTTQLPAAEVGKHYSVQLSCTDPKAQFGEYYNPNGGNDLKKTGLTLTGKGELKGTPTTAGTYSFTVCAAGDGGEGYMTYTLTVKETAETTEPSETTEATVETTETTEAPTDDAVEGTEPLATYTPKQDSGDSGSNWWIFAVIAVVGIGLGIGLALFLVKRKK